MAIPIYLQKRHLKKTKRNGQREYRWHLRWEDPATGKFKGETTGTADRTQAETLQKAKWAEVNGLAPPLLPEPEPEPVPGPTWDDCRDALERAMRADNLRARSIEDALQTFDQLKAAFPGCESPADITPDLANEYKRLRAEQNVSPWTVRGDVATLKAVFGKWLTRECGLLASNPFVNVRAPRCDDPDVRIVTAAESEALFAWLGERWNNWKLPLVYLKVAALLGWRATEIASMREDDLLADGFVRVLAESSKTRKHKYGWLPADLFAELESCCADGWAFGRFSDELRRLLLLWRKQPHHAAKVRAYAPQRLVGWLQDELQRFNEAVAEEARQAKAEGRNDAEWQTFTLHDFRRTAITGMQMAGVTEKEASVMVGATPEVIRKHYEKLDQLAIARKNVERRLTGGPVTLPYQVQQSLRAGCARPVDNSGSNTKTVTA